jgi:hypothetical protein
MPPVLLSLWPQQLTRQMLRPSAAVLGFTALLAPGTTLAISVGPALARPPTARSSARRMPRPPEDGGRAARGSCSWRADRPHPRAPVLRRPAGTEPGPAPSRRTRVRAGRGGDRQPVAAPDGLPGRGAPARVLPAGARRAPRTPRGLRCGLRLPHPDGRRQQRPESPHHRRGRSRRRRLPAGDRRLLPHPPHPTPLGRTFLESEEHPARRSRWSTRSSCAGS